MKNRTLEGLRILAMDLKREMKEPGFYSFRIHHTSYTSIEYPCNHELLELILTYHLPGSKYPHQEIYQYLRNKRVSKWYRCENYRKVGEPLN